MPITVECPTCAAKLRAPDTAAGKRIKCPKCAGIIPVPAAAVPPPREIEEQVAAAPPRRRVEEDVEDRPSGSRAEVDEDGDFGDQPRRRGPRRDAHETEATGTFPMVLGIISIVFAALAIPLSLMSCCPPIAFVAGAMSGLALLLAGIGIVMGFMQQKRGLVCPTIGVGISMIALIFVVVGVVIFGLAVADSSKQSAKAAEEAKKFQEEVELKQKVDKADLEKPDEKKATVAYLQKLRVKGSGFQASLPDPQKPGGAKLSLRATSVAVLALKHLGAELPDLAEYVKFIDSCHDKATGGFADVPGGKPDIAATTAGVLLAVDLDMPPDRYLVPAANCTF